MEDYAGNSRKNREVEPRPKKEVQRVVTGEVIIKKKPIGIKFKELIVEANFGSVGRFLWLDVFVPTVKNLIVDMGEQGLRRAIYGESAVRRQNYGSMAGPRVTYNTPVTRTPGSSVISRPYERPMGHTPGSSDRRYSREEFIVSTREEAELVIMKMNEIIDTFDVVSVADLNELLQGHPGDYVNSKWGWVYLGDARIQQVRDGYLLNLPQAEPIQIIP
jgi:hypothetical protein